MSTIRQHLRQTQGTIELQTALTLLEDAHKNLCLSDAGGSFRISRAMNDVRSTLLGLGAHKNDHEEQLH